MLIWNTIPSKTVQFSSSWSHLSRRLKSISAIIVFDDFQKKITTKNTQLKQYHIGYTNDKFRSWTVSHASLKCQRLHKSVL